MDPVKDMAAMFLRYGSSSSTCFGHRKTAYPCTSMSSLHREGLLERYPMLHTGYSNITTSF